jgi:hypothetical protein
MSADESLKRATPALLVFYPGLHGEKDSDLGRTCSSEPSKVVPRSPVSHTEAMVDGEEVSQER